jgi:hypothetical protein
MPTKHQRDVAKHWGLPVPSTVPHGSHRAARVYGCACGLCLPSGRRRQVLEDRTLTRQERQARSRRNLWGTPVPADVRHSTYTYNIYGCRCELCSKANSAANARQRNAWRKTARGVWTELPDRVILHWKPRTAGPDWVCPDCGWAPVAEGHEEAS